MSKVQKRKGKKILVGGIIVAIVATVAFWLFSPKAETYDEETVKIGDITTYYNFSGNVEVLNTENRVSKDSYTTSSILVSEGDAVKAGDTIMKSSGGTRFKADIDGEVTKIHVEEDDKIMSGATLFDIVDYDNLQTTVKVDEYDLPSIQVGKEVEVKINSLEKTVKGTIYEISKEATSNNGVAYFVAKIKLEHDSDIRVGMTTEIKVLNKNINDVVLVSMDSIQIDRENKTYVYVRDENNKAITKYVEVGISDGLSVEIKSGLNAGDTILIPIVKADGVAGFGPEQGMSERMNGGDANGQ